MKRILIINFISIGDHGGYVTRPLVSTIVPPSSSNATPNSDALPQQTQMLSGGLGMSNGTTLYSTLPHSHAQRNGFTPSTMQHSSTYQQLRLPHPTELDLDLAGMQQTTHFNHPSNVGNNVTSPITIHTANSMTGTPTLGGVMGGPAQANQHQVEGPICSSSPKRTMSAFTTFGPQGQRSNASTPVSPPAMNLPTSTTNGLQHINGSVSVSSNSATPSPQVMTSPLQQQQYLLKKSSATSAGNGPVPTTGHLV